VWRANLDGTGAARIADGTDPDISPDGRWIAFVRHTRLPRTAYLDLYVMRAAGGEPKQIRHYEAPKRLYGFEWSPSSDELVLYEPDRITFVDRNGSDYRVVFGDEPGRPLPSSTTFDPSGDFLAYVLSYEQHSEIHVLSLATGERRQLTGDGTTPLWGFDSIAFHRGGAHGDIWLMRPDGTGQRRLTRTAAGIYPAAWSEDGARLLAHNPAIHNGRLWAVDVRSGRSRRLTDWVADLFPQGLSRDGSAVLAARGCGGVLSVLGILQTIPFEGGRLRTIVRGPCRGDWNA
jgi:Tol biopolymer transport system component